MNVVYGGSFNPPTKAHIEIAKYVNKNFSVDHFIFLPVGSKYYKNNLASEEDRYNMLLLLKEEIENIVVSKLEFN